MSTNTFKHVYRNASLLNLEVLGGNVFLTFDLDPERNQEVLRSLVKLCSAQYKQSEMSVFVDWVHNRIANVSGRSIRCMELSARKNPKGLVDACLRLDGATYSVECKEIREDVVQHEALASSTRDEFRAAPTAPHLCHICKQPLRNTDGKEYLTIGKTKSLAPCSSCGHTTSVYAVIHRCPHCSVLLESPTSQIGRSYECPQCGWTAQTPADGLLPLEESSLEDEAYFEVNCPHCDEAAAARIADVDKRNVCPSCLLPFEIPHGGWRIDAPKSTRVDPSMHCPHCSARLPVALNTCPFCQAHISRSS